MNEDIEIFEFKGKSFGPRLLILGAVHGNEVCGPLAIRRFIKDGILIDRGSLTLVPVCNPHAYELRRRYVEVNLNRFFGIKETPRYYEEKLMNRLCPLLKNCDVVLDIHSYTAGGPPFIIRGPQEFMDRELSMSAALGAETVMHGFQECYIASGENWDAMAGTGTTEYARRYGAYGVTLECGQHDARESPEIAYAAIYRTLAHFGMIEEVPSELRLSDETAAPRHIRMARVYRKNAPGSFIKEWKQLDRVKAGDIIARYDDGQIIAAAMDGVLVMPKASSIAGEEWFYIGVEEGT